MSFSFPSSAYSVSNKQIPSSVMPVNFHQQEDKNRSISPATSYAPVQSSYSNPSYPYSAYQPAPQMYDYSYMYQQPPQAQPQPQPQPQPFVPSPAQPQQQIHNVRAYSTAQTVCCPNCQSNLFAQVDLQTAKIVVVPNQGKRKPETSPVAPSPKVVKIVLDKQQEQKVFEQTPKQEVQSPQHVEVKHRATKTSLQAAAEPMALPTLPPKCVKAVKPVSPPPSAYSTPVVNFPRTISPTPEQKEALIRAESTLESMDVNLLDLKTEKFADLNKTQFKLPLPSEYIYKGDFSYLVAKVASLDNPDKFHQVLCMNETFRNIANCSGRAFRAILDGLEHTSDLFTSSVANVKGNHRICLTGRGCIKLCSELVTPQNAHYINGILGIIPELVYSFKVVPPPSNEQASKMDEAINSTEEKLVEDQSKSEATQEKTMKEIMNCLHTVLSSAYCEEDDAC